MKAALVFLCLSGVILSVDAACDATACTISVNPGIGSEACAAYTKYIDCLNGEKDGCTDSDQANEVAIDTAIKASSAARDLLSCSSAGGLNVSMFSVLLTLIVAFFKP